MASAFRDTPIWVFLRWALGASLLRYPEEEDDALIRIQAAMEKWGHHSVDANIDVEREGTCQNAREKSCESNTDHGVCNPETDCPTPHPLIIVDWYDEKDPANPINWSGRKKSVVYLIVNFTACVVYMASAIYTPSQPLVQEVFGVSVIVASQGLGLFIVGYGVGPLIWSPLSEMPAVGRNLPYLVPLLTFVVLSVPTALANSIGSLLLFLPETSPSTILYYRAKRIRKLTGQNHYRARSEITTAPTTVLGRFYGTLVTPWKINLLDPSILFTSIYSGLIYAIFYSFFEFFPLVYGNIYGMTQGQIGLVLLSNVIAVTVAALPYFAYIHFVVNASARRGHPLTPEQRLVPALVGSVLVPIGIFLFGWTSRDSIHWIVPTMGVCFTVGGFAVLLQTIFVYIGLAYPQYSASLFCGNGFVKQMVAFAGVLWSHPLYEAMGISKAMSLLGTLCVVCISGIFVLYYWGDRLRRRSKFAS
ncbi:hypothetical protein FSOLCH5_006605 [Fusarium solani]